MIGCGDVRIVLKDCSDWLRLSQSSNFWYFNSVGTVSMIMSTFVGRWDGNAKWQINSSLVNGMWVKGLSLIFYFIYWRRWVATSRCGAKWKVHVIRGVALVHLVSYFYTSRVLMNNDCWPWCRSGENVKTASHSESLQLSNLVFIYCELDIEAMAGRRSFLVFIYWELDSADPMFMKRKRCRKPKRLD